MEPIPRLLHAGAYQAPKGQDFLPHRHEESWELVYYRDGRIIATVGDDSYEVCPGVLLLTPPQTTHAEIARTGYANYYIGVDAPKDTPWPRVCYDTADQTLGSLCQSMVREWAGQREGREEMLSLLMRQMDLLLRRAEDQTSEPERAVRAAERIIEERYAERLSVTEIARGVGVSPSTLHAHFAARRRTTPQRVLQAMRLKHALALLRHSTLTLEAVATLCGFDSASHLTRHVKAATGQPPGRLRLKGASHG